MRKRRLLAALATAATFALGAAPGGIEIVVEVPGPPADGAPEPAPIADPPGAAPQPEPDSPLPKTGAPVARLLTVAAMAMLAGAIALRLSASPRPPQGEITP